MITPDLAPLHIATPRYIADPAIASQFHSTDVLVIGGGLAGLTAALTAAEQAEVILLARVTLTESNSAWAQGGIAAALDQDDTPRAHVADTLIAGAGLSDPLAVEMLTTAAPGLMHELAAWGVPFERHGADFALGLEGGHSKRRILHVGDATGWAVTQVLIARVLAHPRIHVRELQVVDLLGDQQCTGVLARDQAGIWHQFLARATILATGGAGALFGISSNPPAALGEGIAMAYRAGAEVADMEFMQFHPTIFRTRAGHGFLITEAARGEGGHLLTPAGQRFMPAYDPRAELAPRDIVTRGIYQAMREAGSDHVLLDLTHLGAGFLTQRFPTIVARLGEEGIDPSREPIPVAPAAHYLMGGIRTNLDAATSLPGLYAAGECACTGVHGANRLASNSLLECLVFGKQAGSAAAAYHQSADVARPIPAASSCPVRSSAAPQSRSEIATIMASCAGPIRTGTQLAAGLVALDDTIGAIEACGEALTCANAALTARLILGSALLRCESRGGHFRSDTPDSQDRWRAHLIIQRDQHPYLVDHIVEEPLHMMA